MVLVLHGFDRRYMVSVLRGVGAAWCQCNMVLVLHVVSAAWYHCYIVSVLHGVGVHDTWCWCYVVLVLRGVRSVGATWCCCCVVSVLRGSVLHVCHINVDNTLPSPMQSHSHSHFTLRPIHI